MTVFPESGLGFGDDQENDKGSHLLFLTSEERTLSQLSQAIIVTIITILSNYSNNLNHKL